jgi:hypothetical protein
MARFAPEFEVSYPFDEISIVDAGILSYGTATLTDDENDGFYVSKIVLDGGTVLRSRGNGALGMHNAFKDELFKQIAEQIEKSDHAAQKFAFEKHEANQPDPDLAYEQMRDDRMHFGDAA